MSTKMEVPLQAELTECFVNARHWLLCLGADLTGDMCWGHGETQSCWRNSPITNSICYGVCSVQFSCSVMSDSLQPHGLQHARSPCPIPSPKVCPNSCPLHQWCHSRNQHTINQPYFNKKIKKKTKDENKIKQGIFLHSCILQCTCTQLLSHVQLCKPMDYCPPGSDFVHGIS